MYKFSQPTLITLHEIGWTDDRQIDISVYKTLFDETNQVYSDIVLKFLSNFGGLEIIYSNKIRSDLRGNLIIDAIEGKDSISIERLNEYIKNWIKKPLCTIGINQQDTLTMTLDGEVYSLFDSYVYKEGNSGEEAIENIITQKPGIRIFKHEK